MRLPVALMSFDRPDHLQAVAQTVLRQRVGGAIEYDYFLFQDGWRHRATGREKCDIEANRRCIDVFKAYFPEGVVVADDDNYGVAHNFDRAERALFCDHDYDAAIFLEDDMLLQPHYFEVLEELIDFALEKDYVGMVSAYGHKVDTPLAEQRRRRREICAMNEHNWGFALTRAFWRRRDPIVRPYLDMIADIDYRDRSEKKDEIQAWQVSYGRGGAGYLSSQDSVKNMASEVLGCLRLSTFTNNAVYIGKAGEHMSSDRFFERGYHRTVLYPEPHSGFERPSWEELMRRTRMSARISAA